MNSVASGSVLRPKMMLETFRKRGYQVLEITGTTSERSARFIELKRRVAGDELFDYLYVESLSRPINLKIVKRFGIKYFWSENLEFEIIDFCLKAKIPTGYYLRDLHWDFDDTYGYEGVLKRLYFSFMLKRFGRKELNFLRKRNIKLFTPSNAFATFLNDKWDLPSTPLLPGAELKNTSLRPFPEEGIHLFYVGGAIGLYDMTVFLNGVLEATNVNCTLCVREKERYALSAYEQSEKIRIVHGSGNQLGEYYNQANIAVYPLNPSGYVKLAFSVKLAEYIGWGLPIIVFRDSEASDFIEKHNIGWVIDYDTKAVSNLINSIGEDPQDYKDKQQCIINLQPTFTWDSVVSLLEEKLSVNESAFTG